MGWTFWQTCPKDGCRVKFMKDVVTAVYEQKQAPQQTGLMHPRSRTQQSTSHTTLHPAHRGSSKPVKPMKNTYIAEPENPIALWMQWNNNYQEPIMPARQPHKHEPSLNVPKVAKLPKQHQRYTPILPQPAIEEEQSSPPRRSPSALSLFPPEYTRSGSPALVSRSPSIAGQSGQASVAGSNGEQSGLDIKTDAKAPFANKLSTYGKVIA